MKIPVLPAAASLMILGGCTVTQASDSGFFPDTGSVTETAPVTTAAAISVLSAETTAAASTLPEITLTTVTDSAPPETAAQTAMQTDAQTAAQTTATEYTAETESYTADLNEADSAWMLMLVNPTHPIEAYTPPELTTLSNGIQIDARIYPALQEMFDAARAAGYAPFTREGFRTFEEQQEIMDVRIARHIAEGYAPDAAKAQAEKYVAIPGKSEHQTGLAVDINASDGNSWALYSWLSEHADEYGFILRYPQGAEKITGYQYEPWHYRYVGKDAAAAITGRNITLEEYLS